MLAAIKEVMADMLSAVELAVRRLASGLSVKFGKH
jgi:hypothetical protein